MRDIERRAGQRPLEQRETSIERREREALAQVKKRPPVRPDAGPLVDTPSPPPGERKVGARTDGKVDAPQGVPIGRLPRRAQVKVVTAWLRTYLKDGPCPAAPIRRECRRRKVPASVLMAAAERARVVSHRSDGVELWGLQDVTGVEIMFTLKEAARLCLWRPASLRSYLARNRAWYSPARYRRHPGKRRERVLTQREVAMLQAHAFRPEFWSRKK